MNWSTDFNFSFEPPAPPRQADLLAVPRLQEKPHGPQTVVATNPHNGKSAVLPLEVANALTHCSRFRTLNEHVDELLGEAPPGDPRRGAIQAVLKQVSDAGLMLSARELLARMSPVSTSDDRVLLTAVIITCDRPFALERLLRSILANAEMARIDSLVVVDDSRLAANQQRNRQQCEQAQSGCPSGIRYFGADEAAQFTGRLLERLPGLSTPVRCLLDRQKWAGYYSAGVARNFSHLLAPGQRVVVFDDDTVCEFWPAPFAMKGCEFNAARRQALFYRELEREARLVRDPASDPVEKLAACLGLSLPEALGSLGIDGPPADSLRHANPDFVAGLDHDSRILVTECGSVGDPGTSDDTWLGLLPDETLQRLIDEPAQVEAALARQACYLGPGLASFAPDANMSQMTGFDNRELLPPYMPVERGQDRIFGEMTRFLHPSSLVLTLPWAIPHLRVDIEGDPGPSSRRMSPDGRLSRMTLLPARRGDECTSSDPQERLDFLASAFAEMSRMSDGDIIERATDLARKQAESLALDMREVQQRYPGLPAPWRQRMDKLIGKLESPQEIRPDTGDDEQQTLAFWRGCWKEFGQALSAWPTIRQAVAEDQ